MKALLLCAGLGTRLRPVTDFVPKCLVPINGKPLLEYWLENLSIAGVTEFIINTHYFKEQVEAYVEQSPFCKNITLVYEEQLLLTAGTILKCKKYLQDESFMVVHADNLSFCNFKDFITAHHHRPKRCEITMMTFSCDNPQQCGVLSLDKENVVQEFFEKVEYPPTNLANAAVYMMEPSVITYLESLGKEAIDLSTEVIPNFLNKIYTFYNGIYHRDIGTVQSYAMAQIEILKYV